MSSNYRLLSLIEKIPPVQFAFAYGSGVFNQYGSLAVSTSTKVVDYVLAVDDPIAWHTQNLQTNPAHYGSTSRWIGSKGINRVAETVGAGVHFNPYVNVESQLCKYGVVRTSKLLDDLRHWNQLYLAGRLHKPVKVLVHNNQIEKACNYNIRAALCAALLLLPQEFTKEELYKTMCGLSYHGDIRMLFAEDSGKLNNISSQIMGDKNLEAIYLNQLESYCSPRAGLEIQSDSLKQQASSVSSRAELLTSLPGALLDKLNMSLPLSEQEQRLDSPESRWRLSFKVASNRQCTEYIARVLARTVRASSIRQALSAFLVTDIMNSSQYVFQKMYKAWMTRGSSSSN